MTVFNATDGLLRKINVVLVLVFSATLASTIFVNQLGYYGALFMLLLIWFNSKKNPFSSSGIEWLLALYLFAVLMATLFSSQSSESFHNLLKRAFLIPIIYTMEASARDEDRIKLFYKAVVFCTALTGLIYCGFALHSYMIHEMIRTGSGPATFQHPITASQMFTFAMMMAVALLINNDDKPAARLIIAAAALILLLALLGTFKRTGWIGAFAGIFTMLLLSRKWLIAAGVLLSVVIVYFAEPMESRLFEYSTGNETVMTTSRYTTGRACAPIIIDSSLFYSEFDKGLVKADKMLKPVETIPFPLPVISMYKANDSIFAAYLFDFSLQLLKYKHGNLQKFGQPLYSPGATANCVVIQNKVYYYDSDSGLTVFRNVFKTPERIRFPQYNDFANFSVDSSYIFFYNATNKTSLFKLDSNGLPGSRRIPLPFNPKDLTLAEVMHGYLAAAFQNHVIIYKIFPDSLHVAANLVTGGLFSFFPSPGKINLKIPRGIISYNINSGQINRITLAENLAATNYSACIDSGKLVVAAYRIGPIHSFFDPYNTSNYTRTGFWRASLKIFRDYPLFGIGDIDVADYYIKYKRATDKEIRGHFHNNFFHILATLGGFGFLVFCALITGILVKSFKIYKECARKKFMLPYAIGLNGVIIAFLIAGLSEWNFGRHAAITFFWLAFGLLLAISSVLKQRESKTDGNVTR